MSWPETEIIDRVELLDTGELFLGLEGSGNEAYQYIYREAAGVYWNLENIGFKSTELNDWIPSDWFWHIIAVVRTGLGVELRLADTVAWSNVPKVDQDSILREWGKVSTSN